MPQIEHGIRKILALPAFYNTVQWAMGAKTNRQDFVDNYVKPSSNDTVLDIGCGTADILNFLPANIRYFGYDQSEAYISHAKQKYGNRGKFQNALVDSLALESLPSMDIVLASGLIHHLDDKQVNTLLETAKSALSASGRFVAIDPCYVDGQSRLSKWLIDKDRGQNIRAQDEYISLANKVFPKVESRVVHRKWVPYTHHILVCHT